MKKTFKNEKVEVNGNHITFDGKFSPKENTLTITKLQGDITLFEEAIQGFCISNNIDKTIIK